MPARTINEARTRATHDAAMAIIEAERRKRDEKTARLRAAREAAERAEEPAKKTSPKKEAHRKRKAASSLK